MEMGMRSANFGYVDAQTPQQYQGLPAKQSGLSTGAIEVLTLKDVWIEFRQDTKIVLRKCRHGN
jgi:hypothetical protein